MQTKLGSILVVAGACLAGTASAAGCLSGAAVGGVAGHVAGHHAVLGAAAVCAINHHRVAVKNRNAAAATAATPAPQTAPATPPAPSTTPVKAP